MQAAVQTKMPRNQAFFGSFWADGGYVDCIKGNVQIDPACGSGDMFVQSSEFIKARQGDINGINIYGQEKGAAAYRLAKMNLALRGLSHDLGETNDSSFTHDLHKGLHFDYIMANPPFNLRGWYDENLKNDARWTDYETPPESNANYARILHILSHLKSSDGVAGFLLAYRTWQGEGINGKNYQEPEPYRSVSIEEIETKGWPLTPCKYIEFIDHGLDIDYEKEMTRIQSEMKNILKAEKESQKMLEDAFKGIGYGIN